MRSWDVFYTAALAILLGWLILGSVIDTQHLSGSRVDVNASASLPPISASPTRPQPVASATVDERNFRIFVAGSPDIWSVAISEDD